jgi:hypothetical protein
MIVRKVLHGAAGAVLLAAGMFVAVESAQAECSNRTYVGRGTGLLRATAGISARADWRRAVAERRGADWTRWSRAQGRVTACRKPEGGSWACTARARACNN